jgi:hypothetical protein
MFGFCDLIVSQNDHEVAGSGYGGSSIAPAADATQHRLVLGFCDMHQHMRISQMIMISGSVNGGGSIAPQTDARR